MSEKGLAFRFVGGSFVQRSSLVEWLEQYMTGRPTQASLIELTGTSRFSRRVRSALQTIPLGKTASYQEVAELVGSPQGARAVGVACPRNPFPLLIPCHRVIPADGGIGGFAVDVEIKRRLLAFEQAISGCQIEQVSLEAKAQDVALGPSV